MRESLLAAQGFKIGGTLHVPVGAPGQQFLFGVRLFHCPGTGKDGLTHADIFRVGDPLTDASPHLRGFSKEQLFWLWVVAFYQEKVNAASETGRIPPKEAALIRRTLLLGYIGIAFPQRHGAFERRGVSQRTILLGEARNEGFASSGTLADGTVHNGDLPDRDGCNAIGVALLGPLFGDTARLQEYLAFERLLLDEMESLRAAPKSSSRPWRQAIDQIHRKLERVRKKADATVRDNLRMLQAACDAARMHMYAQVAKAVLDHPDVRTKLDAPSAWYNGRAHSVQDKLGGIVPATHPLWLHLLSVPSFVSLLLELSKKPEDVQLLNRLNIALATAASVYVNLLSMEGDARSDIKSLDAAVRKSDGAEGSSRVDLLRASGAEDARSGAWMRDELVQKMIMAHEGNVDVAMASDRMMGGLGVEACALKYHCTIGTVSKRTVRGLGTMKRWIRDEGLTSEDLLTSLHGRVSTARQTAPISIDKQDRMEDEDSASSAEPKVEGAGEGPEIEDSAEDPTS